MRHIYRWSIILAILLLSGCAKQLTQQRSISIDQPIYLRGVFTWWDAESQYQLHPVAGHSGLWMTQIELIADGQPYEWKIGDKDWQCGTDFGYLSDDSPMVLGQSRAVDSCAQFNSLKFTPKQDGFYQFYLDVSHQPAIVYINKK
ncbi:hypothetical protein [Celerinatantimonas yamalensis]|uniref:Pullulanase n=1 Tax=Celerinatantimonas yamalensis TaxID=559956 RepID=A0ABW9G910_9GAMM